MTGERLQSVLQQDSAEIEGCYRLNDSLFKYLVGSGGGEEVLMGFLNRRRRRGCTIGSASWTARPIGRRPSP